MNMAIVLLIGIFISYFAICVYGTMKEECRKWREKEKGKRGDWWRGEREGSIKWISIFISFKNLIILNFTDQFIFQAIETFEQIETWNIYVFLK